MTTIASIVIATAALFGGSIDSSAEPIPLSISSNGVGDLPSSYMMVSGPFGDIPAL